MSFLADGGSESADHPRQHRGENSDSGAEIVRLRKFGHKEGEAETATVRVAASSGSNERPQKLHKRLEPASRVPQAEH